MADLTSTHTASAHIAAAYCGYRGWAVTSPAGSPAGRELDDAFGLIENDPDGVDARGSFPQAHRHADRRHVQPRIETTTSGGPADPRIAPASARVASERCASCVGVENGAPLATS